MKHPTRIEAEKNYKSAIAAFNAASNGTDEVAFVKADEAYKVAVAALVSAEMNYPTVSETNKRIRRIIFSSRGLD